MKSYFFDDPYARAFICLFSAAAPYIVIGRFVSQVLWIAALTACVVFFIAVIWRGIYCWRQKIISDQTIFFNIANEILCDSNLFVLPGMICIGLGKVTEDTEIWLGLVLAASLLYILGRFFKR